MWGGTTGKAALVEAALFNEFRFETHPTIPAQGKELFDTAGAPNRAHRLSTATFTSGMTVVKYAKY